MLVSVVTVVFNGAATIEDTLRSVRAQQGVDVEHVVIDGASTDDTMTVIRDSKFRPDVLVSERDQGIYDGMNKGLARSRGEYVGFLNADDFFSTQSALADLLVDAKADCVFGDIDLVDAENTDTVVRRWRTGSFSPVKARLGWQAPHPALYIRKSCFDRWGGFDASMRISADYELALRFLLRHAASWSYRPTCVAKMRMGGRSTRSMGAILEGNMECWRAWRNNRLAGGFLVPFLKPIGKLTQLRTA
jgi:glycosyltransferase involved in cell wall biosynthesis